jgi:ABC-type multidrug transport system fused ATPase/permease subunit
MRRIYILARPFGRRKLGVVLGVAFFQAVFQVLGVTSIFPFLALAADPDRLRRSNVGSRLLEVMPPLDDSDLLLVFGAFAILMLLLANGINLASDLIRRRYTATFAHWLRMGLIRQLAARPYASFLAENSGVALKKILGDVASFTNGVLMPLLDMLARILTSGFLLIALLFIHPQIAIGAGLGLGAFYLIVFRALTGRRQNVSTGLNEANRGSLIETKQLLSGIKPIKVHRAEAHFIERFSRYSATQARLQAWIPFFTNAPRYLVEPLAFGGLVAIVMVYAAKGQDLAFVLPTLAVMALAGYRLLPAVQLIYGQLTQIGTTIYALDEVYDEFRSLERADEAKEHGAGEGVFPQPERLQWERGIELRNLTFRYPGAPHPVFDKLSITIPKKSSLGIVGQTGSGKSTLVDVILGLHIPTSGEVLIDDVVLSPANRRAWRAGIGYVPQDIFLIDDTIAANIAFGVSKDKIDYQALRESAAAAQILEFVETALPEKFETVVGERGVRLSGGQRQRIGLARALYHKPDLLILDEATSALDVATEAEVMNAITSLQGSVTMLIIAHRLTTIEGCEYRLDLNQGSLVEQRAMKVAASSFDH